MEIKNTKELAKLIIASDAEEAERLLTQYHNIIVDGAIERSWDNARKLLRFVARNRTERIRKSMLGYSEETGAISLVNFTRYIKQVEDEINRLYNNGSDEVKDSMACLLDMMFNAMGSIRLDYRTIFRSED